MIRLGAHRVVAARGQLLTALHCLQDLISVMSDHQLCYSLTSMVNVVGAPPSGTFNSVAWA